ncbi:MAG TPA: hypothetical protein DCM28_13355 [Phycisphaerales bacterium]|nr:hypothetical protein [Phycisphaerales bacterium]HCD31341.1 hypothetical protein [Phycisphaerales bacterium]
MIHASLDSDLFASNTVTLFCLNEHRSRDVSCNRAVKKSDICCPLLLTEYSNSVKIKTVQNTNKTAAMEFPMTHHKPDDCPYLMPHLVVTDVKQAMDWYEQVFGMTCRMAIPPQAPVHAELVWQDMVIMIGQAGGTNPSKSPVASGVACPMGLYLYCEDVDALYKRALEHGAKSQLEPVEMFWGDRMCTVKDPQGYDWTFATKVGEFDPSKMPTPEQMHAEIEPATKPVHRSVTVKTLPDLRVIYDRHIGAYTPSNLGPFYKQFMSKVGQLGLMDSQSMVIGICQDDPRDTPDDQCRFDAGVTVNSDHPCPDGLQEQVMPGGDYAIIVHKGPYEGLAETWQWIGEVAFHNLGRECRDQPPFENYLNNPADTAPEDLLTEICIPLY